MNMMGLNAESLSRQLEREIPEVVVVIAKNAVAGLPAEAIAKLLGVEVPEVEEIQETQDYKDVRLLLGAESATMLAGKDSNWDSIEHNALVRLAERVPQIRDTDELLRIAAVANKAQRRNQPAAQHLDPGSGVARVPLKLTRRITERLNADGAGIREEVQEISILSGSAQNPSFQEIDAALGVRLRPQTQEKLRTSLSDDFSVDDLKFGG